MTDREYWDDKPFRWKRGGCDMGQGTYRVLADRGMDFDRANLRELGYQLFQDFEHIDDYKTRWYFHNMKTWEQRIERIESMGYTPISELQIT